MKRKAQLSIICIKFRETEEMTELRGVVYIMHGFYSIFKSIMQ